MKGINIMLLSCDWSLWTEYISVTKFKTGTVLGKLYSTLWCTLTLQVMPSSTIPSPLPPKSVLWTHIRALLRDAFRNPYVLMTYYNSSSQYLHNTYTILKLFSYLRSVNQGSAFSLDFELLDGLNHIYFAYHCICLTWFLAHHLCSFTYYLLNNC